MLQSPMSALKYLPKLTEAFLDALPQKKMTKKQFLSEAKKAQISDNEIKNTMPSLSDLPDDATLTINDLDNLRIPHTYTTSTRTRGESDFGLDDEVRFDKDLDPDSNSFGTIYIDGYLNEDSKRAAAELVVTAKTKEQRAELVENFYDEDIPPDALAFIETGAKTDSLLEDFMTNAEQGDLGLPYLELRYKGELTDYDQFTIDARDDVRRYFGVDSPQTDYEEYVTPGPKEDYTETLTQFQQNPHPDAPQYQDAENPLFTEQHFSNADDVVFHTRSSTRTPRPTPDNPSPFPVLYGEETQSEWAKQHRDQLKRYLEDTEQYEKARAADEDFLRVANEERRALEPRIEYQGSGFADDDGVMRHSYTDPNGRPFSIWTTNPQPDPDRVWQGYLDKRTEDALPRPKPPRIPESPLQSNWEDYALRSLIAEAIDKDLPGVALATGKQNADRYRSFMSAEDAKGLENFYDNKMRNKLSKLGKKYKSPLQTVDIPLSDSSIPRYAPETTYVEDSLFGPVVQTPQGALPSLPQADYIQQEIDLLNQQRAAGMFGPQGAEGVSDYMMGLASAGKQNLDEAYNQTTERAPYLPINDAMKEAIKKGLPLSVLYSIMPNGEPDAP